MDASEANLLKQLVKFSCFKIEFLQGGKSLMYLLSKIVDYK